jgi:hypothetical protein
MKPSEMKTQRPREKYIYRELCRSIWEEQKMCLLGSGSSLLQVWSMTLLN